MTALSAAVVAEDLRSLAESAPFDTATVDMLERAADLLEERPADADELDRLRHLEQVCLDANRKVATHELRGWPHINVGFWAPVRAALAESPLHPSCPIDLDEVLT